MAQWLGTTLWFSPSGAADGLMAQLGIGTAAFGWLIAATQLGFIAGTVGFALTGAADRFAASRIFAFSSMVGALANAALVTPGVGFEVVWALRFGVGLCLAGIYPMGMKMIVQWVGGKPAAALSWLVGMLTLGTAMPHGLRAAGASWPWEAIMLISSALAVAGAVMIFILGDRTHASILRPALTQLPSRPKPAAISNSLSTASQVFAIKGFRSSAFGYFGHMWEVYAFWSVLPWLCAPLVAGLALRSGGLVAGGATSVALLSFLVIAAGCLGSILGGYLSRYIGSAYVAASALAGSGLICLIYPLIPEQAVAWRLAALFFWGFFVVADSPHFSALSAQHCPPQWLGSALVMQNGIGFSLTVVSILILSYAVPLWGAAAMWILLPGPILGLWAMRALLARA